MTQKQVGMRQQSCQQAHGETAQDRSRSALLQEAFDHLVIRRSFE
jgi:hypothetical protein